jgi:hypothetical protein
LRVAPLALALCSLFACGTSETKQTKASDSTMVVLPAVDNPATAAPPPAPVVAQTSYRDTIIPRLSLDTTAWTDPQRLFDTTESAPDIQCAPALFTAEDTLGLRFKVPHGDWLRVKRPDETVFNIVSPTVEGQPNYTVVPADTFKTMPLIRFHGDIKSRALLPGHENVETIFDQRGWYTFQVGEDMGGGSGSNVHECSIKLVPRSKY